jgi:hypothetical protein
VVAVEFYIYIYIYIFKDEYHKRGMKTAAFVRHAVNYVLYIYVPQIGMCE